jgi:hypothetical protein
MLPSAMAMASTRRRSSAHVDQILPLNLSSMTPTKTINVIETRKGLTVYSNSKGDSWSEECSSFVIDAGEGLLADRQVFQTSEDCDGIGLKNEACQSPSFKGARVNIDAVGANVGLSHRRMAMDNGFAKIALVLQEVATNS